MIIEFLYHEVYGRDASSKRVRKLASDEAEGINELVCKDPAGLMAAEMRNRIGKSAQIKTTRPRACRHQVPEPEARGDLATAARPSGTATATASVTFDIS
jgi:hypothetical protein